jgi:outer membrane receptor protein involved in Fe transport
MIVGAPSGAIILLSIVGIAAEAAPTAAPAIAAEAAPTGAPTEIVVLASQLREAELATVPVSVTQLDTATIGAASLQHFEELSSQVPNLNWSGEGSRARYFQIRGTGELEQYDGAPNPSVGFVIDDIDLSGIGAVATTFDLKGIEVLRGPQGVRYGANALAGLIYVQGNEPTPTPVAELELTGGSDDTRAFGVVLGGAVPGTADSLAYRLAVQQYDSDGFRRNAYLGRDDTNQRDELSVRGKLRWQASEVLRVDFTGLHVDLDNGYDAFAIDNGFTTWSDQPGRDAQQTDAGALRVSWQLGFAELLSITGLAHSDMQYGFDADWGNPAYWAPYVYQFSQAFERERDTVNQELRLISGPDSRLFGADWVTGVYVLDVDESNARRDQGVCDVATCGYDLLYDTPASSDYSATSVALFGAVSRPLSDTVTVSAGLRWEQRAARYRDNVDSRFNPRDSMLGGELGLTHEVRPGAAVWARIARGYKAGGFNTSLAGIDFDEDDEEFPEFNLDAGNIEFDPEYLWDYALGLRLGPAAANWSMALNVFMQQRDDPQIKVPVQLRLGDPTTYVFVTDNASDAETRGVELEASWQLLPTLSLGTALGLLHTEIGEFSLRPELDGGELAHAPRYTFALNASWRSPQGWFVRADYGGKASYTIDYCQSADCNDPETSPYQVLDLRAGREWGSWTIEAWARNVLDEDYALRGFYFGNEPPDFTPQLYTRNGDPRQAGLTLRYRFGTW